MEPLYFSHDYNASTDPNMLKMRIKFGVLGVGMYWMIVEMLYQESTHMLPLSDIDAIALQLHCEESEVREFLEDCFDRSKLFKQDDEKFWSESVFDRLQKQIDNSQKRSENARTAAQIRWARRRKNEQPTLEQPKKFNPDEATFADCVRFFDNNIHPIVQNEKEKLEDWEKDFPPPIIYLALTESVSNNVRKMSYINGILRTWQNEGLKNLEQIKNYIAERKGKIDAKRGNSQNRSSTTTTANYDQYNTVLQG